MKFCPKCRKLKNEIDFHKNKARTDGYHLWCKKCRKEETTKYRATHAEQVKIAKHNYYENNKQTIISKSDEWVKNNKPKSRIIKNRWKANNPESEVNYRHKRRSKCKQTDITGAWLKELKENTEICILCGNQMIDSKKYHPLKKSLDHILLLSKGGTHTKNNVRYVCILCNAKRNGKHKS
jgi:hypothetical protein